MWWVFFGCMSESVDVQEPVVNNEVLSQGAETVIQHLQTQLGADNETNGIQVWLTPGIDWVQPLATLFNGQPISDVAQLRKEAILIVPIVKGMPMPNFKGKRVVSVLEGKWSPKEVHPILGFSEGLIDLEKSLSRYTSPIGVSPETKTMAIILELNNHYVIAQQKVPDVWQTHLDPGLWSKVAPEWLTIDASDMRTRKIESVSTAETVNLLSQINTDWATSEMVELVNHTDPWVRAQAALMSVIPQHLIRLANDDSSVVRVAALHQMNQNILKEDGCTVGNVGKQKDLPSCHQ